jgi:hypothetical protein
MNTGFNQTYPTTSTPASGASSAEIKREIDRTRAEMDQTVDALGNRLQPRHLIDDVLGWIRSSGGPTGSSSIAQSGSAVKDAGSMALDKLKQHPLPAALIGAGVVWLLLEGDNKSRQRAGVNAGRWPLDYDPDGPPMHSGSYVDARTGKPYDEATYGAEYRGQGQGARGAVLPPMSDTSGSSSSSSGSTGGGIGATISGAASSVGSALQGAKEAVTGAVSSATGAVSGAVGSAGGQVGNWAGSARGYTSSGSSAAGQYARQGYGYSRDAIREASEEYPLAVGVAALALGAVAGLLLPGTRREDELMGQQSDQLKSAAMETGEDLLERGKDAASSVKDAAMNTVQAVAGEARGQNLTPGSLAEKVKHVATAAIAAGSEAAKEEGISPQQLGEKAKSVADKAKETAKNEAGPIKDKLKPS